MDENSNNLNINEDEKTGNKILHEKAQSKTIDLNLSDINNEKTDKNISTIYIGECEQELRKSYHIPHPLKES